MRTLDAIHLDTASLLSPLNVPTKDQATSGLVSLMSMMPPSTLFFINAWTWGYEDIYKAVARAFHSKIHLDRYKHSIYLHIEGDPFLQSIITRDAASTRFHACERFNRCEHVSADGQGVRAPSVAANMTPSLSNNGTHVVYVNPVTMGVAGWDLYLSEMTEKLKRREVVNHLLVPLSRHSPLPELQAFVSLFKPKCLIPNTLDPALKGLDWACMRQMFSGCLASSGPESTADDAGYEYLPVGKDNINLDAQKIASNIHSEAGEDVALKNLEGEGAREVAERWADNGKLRKKLEMMKQYLRGRELRLVERVLDSEGGTMESSDQLPEEVPTHSLSDAPLGYLTSKSFQGRATLAETANALARIHFMRPSHTQRASDEETDGESDNEYQRGLTAYHIFGPRTHGGPNSAWTPQTSSSPVATPRSSPVRRGERKRPLATLPLTPRIQHDSQNISTTSSPIALSSGPASKRARNLISLSPCTRISSSVQAKRHLGSSVQLSPLQTATNGRLKRSILQIPTPKTVFKHCRKLNHQQTAPPKFDRQPGQSSQVRKSPAPLEISAENITSPSVNRCLTGTRQEMDLVYSANGFDESHGQSERRKIIVEQDSKASESARPSQRHDISEDVNLDLASHGILRATRPTPTLMHFATASDISPTRPSKCVSSRSEVYVSDRQRKQALRIERLEIAEKLSLARPDLVTPKLAARLRRSKSHFLRSNERKQRICSQQSSKSNFEREVDETPAPSCTRTTIQTLNRHSPQDGGHAIRYDVNRSRKLAEEFKDELGRGRRPGIVIPLPHSSTIPIQPGASGSAIPFAARAQEPPAHAIDHYESSYSGWSSLVPSSMSRGDIKLMQRPMVSTLPQVEAAQFPNASGFGELKPVGKTAAIQALAATRIVFVMKALAFYAEDMSILLVSARLLNIRELGISRQIGASKREETPPRGRKASNTIFLSAFSYGPPNPASPPEGYAPPGARSEVLGVDVPIPKKLLCEEISLETSDRITLHGILVQEDVPVISRPKQPHVVILYLQGNAGNPLSRLPVFERLLVGSPLGRPARALHISILAVAPRSYWKSSSRTPTEHGIVSDYKHTLSHIAYQYPNSSIVLYGHSLGGSIAVCLASQLSNADYPTVKGLILENPFSSIPDMLRALYPQRWLPYRYLTPFAFDRWDAISAMKIAHHQQSSLLARLSKEMLVLLSEKDEMVPTSMGMALYSASEQSDPAGASTRDHGAGRSAKRLIVIRGALHEHGWMEREWLAVMTEYLQEIQRR
ncbi:uncharacterized protein FIBRA_00524 [Fibroporia radiculosa]|uniref:AB hydrolase-1 domain-containing protein n=1 Tax=Fibroporia radiculosa TaxID=599839 RepID=J4GHZ9_9APHY|nr:uncharacterized protein FIBRA_00524 [Fibroporia radiculosa]CCL98525.1 predicted protein [Fibroporia radiculosa]